MNKKIGIISKKIINILNLEYSKEKNIFVGDENIKHMKEQHPDDFKKYGNKIEEILKDPTYLARNKKKNSIEFIKKYKSHKDEYVLIAVRVSNNNINFVRTMYVMADEKVEKYFKNNYFFKF